MRRVCCSSSVPDPVSNRFMPNSEAIFMRACTTHSVGDCGRKCIWKRKKKEKCLCNFTYFFPKYFILQKHEPSWVIFEVRQKKQHITNQLPCPSFFYRPIVIHSTTYPHEIQNIDAECFLFHFWTLRFSYSCFKLFMRWTCVQTTKS